jgi:hypothetical protein
MQKFKAGDRVRIVGYGHPIFFMKKGFKEDWKKDQPDNIIQENETMWWVDMSPEEVGQEATVEGSYTDLYGGKDKKPTYSLIRNNGSKCAWFDEQQLELI